jgi:hypothetical protein
VIHFQPTDSPLREEVEDLWARRKEQEVIDKLSPFMFKGEHSDTRMLFHNAVMRWKCSLLHEDEHRELQEWIESDVARKWDIIQYPWKPSQGDGVDDLTAENQYVQE